MNRNDIKKLIKACGEDHIDKGDWINFPCIFAPWSHQGGVDRKASAGICVDDFGPSRYYCFACTESGFGGRSATVKQAIQKYQTYRKENLSDLVRWVNEKHYEDIQRLQKYGPTKKSKRSPPSIDKVMRDMEVYPDCALDAYKIEGTHPYLEKRGISQFTANQWEVGFDEEKERIVFPVRRPDKKLIGLVGRTTDPEGFPKYFNYWSFRRSASLFGAQFLSPKTSRLPLCVVEGPFDALKVAQAGFRVVATLGALVSQNQCQLIQRYTEKLVVFFDDDKSGASCAKVVKDIMNFIVPVIEVFPLDEKDPGDLSSPEIKKILSPHMKCLE